MKRKLLTMVLAAAVTLSSFGFRALADEATPSPSSAAGITPDSILYPVDKLLDEIRIIFSFTDGSKVETLLNVAQERLGESQVMADENKDAESTEALQDYKDTIEAANEKLDETITKNVDSTDTATTDKIANLENQVSQEQTTSTQVLDGMKDEVKDPEAQKAINIVIEMQTAKGEAVTAMVNARHELNAARKAYNMAKVALKKAEKSKDEEAVKKAEDALAQTKTAYDTEKQQYAEAFANKQEVVKKYAGIKLNSTSEDTTTVDQNAPADGSTTVGQATPASGTTTADQTTPASGTTAVDQTTPASGTTAVDQTTQSADATAVTGTQTTDADTSATVNKDTTSEQSTSTEITNAANTKVKVKKSKNPIASQKSKADEKKAEHKKGSANKGSHK